MDVKCRSKPLEESVFEKFKGSCVVQIIHAFSGKTCDISICADEIINYESKKSYYDEFPEEVWGPRNHRPPSRVPPAGQSEQNKMSPNGEILHNSSVLSQKWITFLVTQGTHYVVNPKHDWLIGTILLFATKKAKHQRVDLN